MNDLNVNSGDLESHYMEHVREKGVCADISEYISGILIAAVSYKVLSKTVVAKLYLIVFFLQHKLVDYHQ